MRHLLLGPLVLALAWGAGSETGALAAAGAGFVLVVNKTDRTLGIIDPEKDEQIAAVPLNENTGHEVAASADGRYAFVPIFGNSGVGSPGTDGQLMRVIDLAKRETVATVDFGKGVRPHEALLSPADGLLYVTTENENSVTVVDPHTFKVLHTVPTGQEQSHMLALTRDGRKGYTSNVGPGTISVLDLKERKVTKVIPVCEIAQRISLSADDRWVFTSDQRKARLAVIDSSKEVVADWIELPGTGYGTAPTPDGKLLLVAMPGKRAVAFVDVAERKVVATLEVPRAPQEILVPPSGATAFVSCDNAGQVAMIDVAAQKVTKLIKAGAGADGLAWAPSR